jgi:hypothetical protein
MEIRNDDKLIDLFSAYLGIEITELANYYSKIEKSYNSESNNPSAGFVSVEKFSNVQFKQEKTLNNWKNTSLIGLDLPLLFTSDNPNAETVVIVGIDPLRKRKDFRDFKPGNVIIGTPYALHSTFYRESKGRTKSYSDFVKHVVSKGYNVYVTDIFKIWMNDSEKTEKDRFYFGDEISESNEVLLQEIEIIQPKIIIAFGNLVEKHLTKIRLSDEIKITKLPHPSGANRNWGKATFDQKVNYLCSEIDKTLI